MGKGCTSLDSIFTGGIDYLALYPKLFANGLPQPGEKNILADGGSAVSADIRIFGDRVYSALGMERILVYGDGTQLCG